MSKKIEEFATVKACLDAGHTWEECIKFDVREGEFKAMIKKNCPACMRRELSDMALSGKGVAFSLEPKSDVPAEPKDMSVKPALSCKTGKCYDKKGKKEK